MSMKPCLPGLVQQGKISQEQADRAGALFDELAQDLRRQFGDQAADAMATDAALKALEREATRKRLLTALTISSRQRIERDMRLFGGGSGDGPPDPRAGPAFLASSDRAPYSNVDGRRQAIRARAHAMMDRILSEHSTNVAGQVRNPAQLADIVRELFGEDSGNLAAREMADAWTRTAEMLRRRFNAAGGDIGKLDRWALPQSHRSDLVRAAGYEAWRAEILPRLDRSRMIDQRTGLPFSDEGLELALRDVFEGIRSESWDTRTPGGIGQAALANRRSDSRFLVFKTADDWMAYSERFGAGNAYDAMMHHIDGMALDTAMMEILGPNPAATVQWLKDSLVKAGQMDGAPGTTAIDDAKAAGDKIDQLWNELTGEARRPANRKLALTFSAVRSWQTAAKLGGALLSAVTDLAFQFSTRRFNGLPATGMLRDYVRLFRPGSVADQRLAVRLGLIAREWAGRTAGQSRFLGEEVTGEVSRRLAEGVLRVSGLNRWTEAGRWAFGMEFLGHVTDQRGVTFDALDPAFRGLLERYGFTPSDWDAIRATPLEADGGAEWIKPANVADGELGDRLLEMIQREADFAVPTADLETRAIVNAAARRGTWMGEVIRSAALFKSFGISIMLMHGRRAMALTGANRARYIAGLAIGSTLMGALAIQLKDVAAGRDPRNTDSGEFWWSALLQGGGFGIFGDFLRSAQSRAGSGIAGTLAGPMFTDAQALANALGSERPQGGIIKFVKGQLPGGTLWYGRLAFDRLVADQLQEMVDPHYTRSWRRMEQWAAEQGTDYWWEPGEAMPDRAPDLSNAISIDEGSMTP